MRQILVVFVALILLAPADASAQKPYVLSLDVQRIASANNVGGVLEVKFTDPKGVMGYLDLLTAVDLMAWTRAKRLDRPRPDAIEDYPIAFAAATSWPNKPPTTRALRAFIVSDVRGVLAGIYVSPEKQSALPLAMGPLLLKGTLDQLIKFLTNAEMGSKEYTEQVLDITKLRK